MDTETQGRRPCDRNRSWTDALASQGTPRIASNNQKLERGKEGSSSRAFRGSVAPIDTSSLQTVRKYTSVVLNQFVVLCYGSLRKVIH